MEESSENKSSVTRELRFLLKVLFILIRSTILAIPKWLQGIIELIAPRIPKNISGQLALVTCGSSGVGKAIAMRLAKEGCNIAIADRNPIEGEKTAKEIREKFDVKAQAFKVDVTKVEQALKLKETVQSAMGLVDILVNNAGLMAPNSSLLKGTPQDIQNIIDANMTAHFWVTFFRIIRP